jgi:fructose-1,6-bisphosphatase
LQESLFSQWYRDSYSYSTKEQQEKHIVQYLEKFDCEKVVHGHTRFKGSSPQISFNGKVINVDGSMSIGYRSDVDRGFILEL